MGEQIYQSWFDGKTFTTDWTSHHFATWESVLAERRTTTLEILEIGSWEGRSAVFFLNFFADARMTCVDTFAGSVEHTTGAFSEYLPDVERRFDDNLAEFGDRVEKLKARSTDALAQLGIDGRRFDLVYVDGSHRAVDVYADGAMAWPLLAPGGALLFDDYTWVGMPDERDRPKLGIDAFLHAFHGQCREVHRDLQIMVERPR